MKSFNDNFYTIDFDQEMMDFIEDSYTFSDMQWNCNGDELVYGVGNGYFRTNTFPENSSIESTTSRHGYTKLTKQQFKEKIGMPVDTPVKEEATFSKKDLVDGMFVKCRNGEIHIVLGGIVCDDYGFLSLGQDYNEDMLFAALDGSGSEYDIMEVFVKNNNQRLYEYLSGEGLKSIWKRAPSKSEKVLKLEELIRMHEERLEATKKLLEEELSNV